MPLILGKRGLLARRANLVLGLPLLLPLRDLRLLARKLAGVILLVVHLGVVGLNGIEKKVAVLLKERIDGKVKRIEVGSERGRGRERKREGGGSGGVELVEEGGEEVGVLDGERKLGEDVAVGEVVLGERSEGVFALTVGGHEGRGEAVGMEGEGGGGGTGGVVDQGDRALGGLGLEEELVLDEGRVELKGVSRAR